MSELRAIFGMSLQVALLGAVSPSLRAVSIRKRDDQAIIFFYYDGPISEEDRESASTVETELLADLYPEHPFTVELVRLDMPAALPRADFRVYHRREN